MRCRTQRAPKNMSMDHHFLTPRFLNTYCKTKPQVDLPGGPVVKNSPANAGYMGSIPDPGSFHISWGN